MQEKQTKEVTIIKLDDTFYLEADEKSFTLIQKRMGKDRQDNPKEFLDEMGYHGDLGNALRQYMKVAANHKFKGQVIEVTDYVKACQDIMSNVIKTIPKEFYESTPSRK